MKVVVTGGAGFIGSHLVDRLMAEGHHVTVYDNLTSGRQEFIAHHFSNPKFKFVHADLLNMNVLCETMTGNDIVFHLAANPDARLGTVKTNLDLEQNTLATYNVLESMRKNNVTKIVFTSSGTIYGETADVPIAEDYGPVLPISLYGASKVACEALISAFVEIFDMQAWIFRFGNIIGDRATHGVIFDLINKLKVNNTELEVLGDGNQTKPYVYVDDCVAGILYGIQYATEKRNVYNLAVPTTTSVKGIVNAILQKTGSQKTVVNYSGGDRGWTGDVPRVQLNITKFKKLGWTAKYSSDEAVSKTIDAILSAQNPKTYPI
jgi:UDP-glucose 4-epimerase